MSAVLDGLCLGIKAELFSKNENNLVHNERCMEVAEDKMKVDTEFLKVKIQTARKSRQRYYQIQRKQLIVQKQLFSQKCKTCVDNIKSEYILYQRKLKVHGDNSIRRLQELLFECIGEFEKSIRRAGLRKIHHRQHVDDMVQTSKLNYHWKRYLQMMEKEVLGKYCFHDVTPKVPVDSTHTSESLDCFEMEMYQELNEMVELVALPRKRYVRDSFVKNPEFSKLSRDIVHRLDGVIGGSNEARITRIVEVRHIGEKKWKESNTIRDAVKWQGTTDRCLHELIAHIGKSKRKKSSAQNAMMHEMEQFVTTDTILSSHYLGPLGLKNANSSSVMLMNTRIYVALDAAYRNTKIKALQKLYVSDDTTIGKKLVITNAHEKHRSAYESNFPDVLESTDDDGGSHYFIAATVGELCQSLHVQTFCENDSRIEEKLFKRFSIDDDFLGLVSDFYVLTTSNQLAKAATSVYENCQLNPISSKGIQVLCHNYLGIHNSNTPRETGIQSFDTTLLLPHKDGNPSSTPVLHCIMEHPSNYFIMHGTPTSRERKLGLDTSEYYCTRDKTLQTTKKWGTEGNIVPPVSSLLIQYTLSKVDATIIEKPSKRDSKKKKTSSIPALGSFCLWRSCIAEVPSIHHNPHRLCAVHIAVKSFLDSKKSTGTSESSRYLPKPYTKTSSEEASNSVHADLKLIKSSSSLVQELLSEKLSKTIVAFCRRAATIGAITNEVTSKLEALEANLENNLRRIQNEHRFIEQHYRLELDITSELEKWLDAGKNPNAAICSIERDLCEIQRTLEQKSLSSSEIHLELANRKFKLLRQKRFEDTNVLQAQLHVKSKSMKDIHRRRSSIHRPATATRRKPTK